MGDQLAKGWADEKAQAPKFVAFPDIELWMSRVDGAPSASPIEAEVQAEEDMLP